MRRSTVFVLSLIAAAQTPWVSADPISKIPVSAEEFTSANLKGEFSNGLFKLNGVLPAECSDRLSIDGISTEKPEKSISDAEGIEISKDELKDYASKIKVSFNFKNDADVPTLKDCLTKFQNSAPKATSHLYHLLPSSSKLAIVTVGEDGTEWRSPELERLEKQYTNLDCSSCNSSWSKARSTLKNARGFDSPLLDAMMVKLLEESITSTDQLIDSSKEISELEKIKKQLFEMLDFASDDAQKEKIILLVEKSISKNFELSKTGHKTASVATRHANYAHDSFSELSKLSFITSDKKNEYRMHASHYAKGSDQRVHLIASIDGDHPEIRTYLSAADQKQRALLSEMQRACNTPNPQAFMLCGEMQKVFQENEKVLMSMQNNYVNAYNQSWNDIHSTWDHGYKMADQNWRTTYQMQSPSNAMNTLANPQFSPNMQVAGVDRIGTQQQIQAMPNMNQNQYPSLYFPFNGN